MSGGPEPSRPEFSRPVDLRELTGKPVTIEATAEECAALAERFAILSLKSLTATVTLEPKGRDVVATGRLKAKILQTCAVSGDELPGRVEEDFTVRFVPARKIDADEIELEEDDLDEIAYEGTSFDLGEAVAQSLALAIDPYATGPDAESFREQHGLAEKAPDGPLQQALKGLKRD